MSAPTHTTLRVQQFLTKNDMTSLPRPPYSPDLSLSDFFLFVYLFPCMKKVLKGKHFADVDKVKQKTAEVLKGIKIDKFWVLAKMEA